MYKSISKILATGYRISKDRKLYMAIPIFSAIMSYKATQVNLLWNNPVQEKVKRYRVLRSLGFWVGGRGTYVHKINRDGS